MDVSEIFCPKISRVTIVHAQRGASSQTESHFPADVFSFLRHEVMNAAPFH